MPPVVILGAGTWGSALADVLARNGHAPKLWDRTTARLDALASSRYHDKLKHALHPDIGFTPQLNAEAIAADAWLVVAIPSFAVRDVLTRLIDGGVGRRQEVLVLGAKGLELPSGKSMVEVATDVLGEDALKRLVVLGGPSHAEEVVRRQPTAVVVAAQDATILAQAQRLFINERLRVYAQHDWRGVELGGAFKNVYAIAAGVIAGLGFGDNTLAAMMTRAVAEMCRLGVALGADAGTLVGLAGLGDLIVTCTSKHSRNRRFGEYRAQGMTTAQAEHAVGQAVEGIRTAACVYELARKHNIETPLLDATVRVMDDRIDLRTAVDELMKRDAKNETSTLI